MINCTMKYDLIHLEIGYGNTHIILKNNDVWIEIQLINS